MALLYNVQQLYTTKFQAEIEKIKISHTKMERIHDIYTAFIKI